MADKLYTSGYQALFTSGFTNAFQWIRLFTSAGVLVDEQPATFTYQTDKIGLSADVVFSVSAGTNDVSYVEIGRTDGTSPALDRVYYRKDLAQLYDFTTAGTLTLDTFTLAVSGTSLTADGRQALLTTGWTSIITQARINNSGGIIDTKAATLSAVVESVTGYCTLDQYLTEIDCTNGGGLWEDEKYNLELSAQVNLDVPASTNNINNAQLLNASNTVFFSRTLPSPAPYSFTTAGELRIKTWVIEI